jgi:uncharacterized membrane protein
LTTNKYENQSLLLDKQPEDLTDGAIPEKPLVVPAAEPSSELKEPQTTVPPAKAESSQVTVVPNLSDLVTGKLETAEDQYAVRRTHNLNEVVHHVLIFGLALSTVLILIGLGLDLVDRRQIPTAVPGVLEAFRRAAALRPSGFLTLGLLVLVATPILRVIGSTLAFLYERDWRYAAITFLVLVVVSLSLLLGQG